MILGLIQELIPPIHTDTAEPGSVTMTHKCLSSLLYLGRPRDLPATQKAHVQHSATPWYQISPTQLNQMQATSRNAQGCLT